MLEPREIDRITLAIRECSKECEDSSNRRETIEKFLARLRRRGWPEASVLEVATVLNATATPAE
jgi:hypothetical protein